MENAGKILVIGLGNEFRSDDGVGPILVRQLIAAAEGAFEAWVHAGEPSELLDRWENRDVVIIDAIATAAGHGGGVHILLPMQEKPLAAEPLWSSHGLGLMETLALGAILHKLPRDLVVLGIEGENFSPGQELSPAVKKGLGTAFHLLLAFLREYEVHHARIRNDEKTFAADRTVDFGTSCEKNQSDRDPSGSFDRILS